jgi:hypothetical protein
VPLWTEGARIEEVILQLQRMSRLAHEQLTEVIQSYEHRDVTAALSVWRRDREIDAINNSLFRELLTYMMEDPRNITFCTHMLFCAKNIERIGDHTTNIAETVYYIVEGRALPDERPKADLTSRVPSCQTRLLGPGSNDQSRPSSSQARRTMRGSSVSCEPPRGISVFRLSRWIVTMT